MAIERTAPTDLDGVAKLLLIARFAQDAVIELLAVFGSPLQELRRAVDGNAFLITGNQERYRALRLAAILVEILKDGGDRTRNSALHVHGTAPVKLAIGDCGGERRMFPCFLISRRYDVGVAAEQQIRLCGTDTRVEVF